MLERSQSVIALGNTQVLPFSNTELEDALSAEERMLCAGMRAGEQRTLLVFDQCQLVRTQHLSQ